VKVVQVGGSKPWPAIAAAGAASTAGVAGLVYAFGGFEPAGPTPEELAALKAAEEKKKQREEEEKRLVALEEQRLAEEAKRRAEEEAAARAEAERAEAAAAARREELVAGVAQALATVKSPGVSAEAAASLVEALRAASVESVLLENAAVVEAKARLEELRRVAESREALELARVALQEAMLSRSAAGCRSALATIDASTEVLTSLGEAVPADGGLADQGRSDLQVLEIAEIEAMRRAAAMAGLEAAVKSRSAEECVKAISEAQVAGLGPCPELELAEVLSDPERLYQALAREGAGRIMDQQGSLTVIEGRVAPPLSVEDFTAAAKISASDLNEAELRQRAAELARAIVVQHQLRADELQAELKLAEAELVQRAAVRMDEALERFKQVLDAEQHDREAALEEVFQRRSHEAVGEVVGQIFGEADVQLAKIRGEADVARQENVSAAREEFQRRFSALSEPVAAIDKLVIGGKSIEQRSQTGNKLSKALIKLQGALVAGRPAYQELAALQAAAEEIGTSSSAEEFVSRLLSALPAETVEWSRGGMHSEPQLANSFRLQLGNFVAGAFALPAQGLVSGAISSFTSSIFGHYYVLGTEPRGAPSALQGAPKEVQQNLEVLGKAAHLVELGNLRLALGAMEESLSGECRRRATAWMTDVRNALLLQQAARAAQAKVRCLHAVIN